MKKLKQPKTPVVERISERLDVPKETIFDIPVITMIGDKEVHIENFISILRYEEMCIQLKTQCGILSVEGKKLIAKSMDSEEIHIKGKIQNVGYVSEEG